MSFTSSFEILVMSVTHLVSSSYAAVHKAHLLTLFEQSDLKSLRHIHSAILRAPAVHQYYLHCRHEFLTFAEAAVN